MIQHAISCDARDQTFGVKLHDSTGRTRIVTRDDLQQDRTFGPDHAGGANTHSDGQPDRKQAKRRIDQTGISRSVKSEQLGPWLYCRGRREERAW